MKPDKGKEKSLESTISSTQYRFLLVWKIIEALQPTYYFSHDPARNL